MRTTIAIVAAAMLAGCGGSEGLATQELQVASVPNCSGGSGGDYSILGAACCNQGAEHYRFIDTWLPSPDCFTRSVICGNAETYRLVNGVWMRVSALNDCR